MLSVPAGDLLLMGAALFHSGCGAEDPSGMSGNGADELLRAICILAMTPTRLVSPDILAARRRAFELDICKHHSPSLPASALSARHPEPLFLDRQQPPPKLRCLRAVWPHPRNHTAFAANLMKEKAGVPSVRDLARAEPMVQRLVDPTWPGAARL